jgi:4-amino-4-deoxy-L-arabinose transferase-like glycosyltransferase
MHCDEVGVFYDTYTLAKFGVDRYLKSYPVYFINFGGGMPALYNYILLAIVKVFNVFDFGLFIGRLPAVINSFILLFSSYQITLITTKKQVYAIFTALLITISPYFIMSSRWALDCNYLLGFTTLSCYLMLLAVEKKKNYLFMITGLSFGFTLYSYALAYILVPLFLFLSVIYLYIKK